MQNLRRLLRPKWNANGKSVIFKRSGETKGDLRDATMRTWKRLAIELFPEHNVGWDAFRRPHMTIGQVFFKLKKDAELYIHTNDRDGLARIFKFVNWCFSQRNRNPKLAGIAATHFLEHLADNDESASIIPIWVQPEVFLYMENEFRRRRERDGEGKFRKLLDEYNRQNSTDFQ